MGLFDFLRKPKAGSAPQPTHHSVFVYNSFYVDLPVDWVPYESDRFRTKGRLDGVQFSISSYSKPMQPHAFGVMMHEGLQNSEGMFRNFVEEGGYIPNDDLQRAETYLYQSFTVDEETQYYYHTYRKINAECFMIAFIIREVGAFNPLRRQQILEIGESIARARK